jgi:hypothetical protein
VLLEELGDLALLVVGFVLDLFEWEEGGYTDVFDAFQIEIPPLPEGLGDEVGDVPGAEDGDDFFGVIFQFFGSRGSGAAVFVYFFAQLAHGLAALLHFGDEGG